MADQRPTRPPPIPADRVPRPSKQASGRLPIVREEVAPPVDALGRAEAAERRAEELEDALRRERRKSAPTLDPEPAPSLPPSSKPDDKVALWLGRAVLVVWRKLGWGGSAGVLSVLAVVLGGDRLQTAWARISTIDASNAEYERRVSAGEERLGELAAYVVCIEEEQAAALEALTPPKDQMAVTSPKLKAFERRCPRPKWLRSPP